MDNVSGLPLRGQTFHGNQTITSQGQSNALEGQTKLFPDRAPGQAAGAKTRRSNRMSMCMLVRNSSGIALLPKRIVKWKAGERGREVDGYCAVNYEDCAGVVDEHLPAAGAPDKHLFWIAVRGPSLVLTALAGDANNVINEGDILVALTAATSQATTAGRMFASASTMGGTQALRAVGVAMSAKTTANTNADCLVDLFIFKTN